MWTYLMFYFRTDFNVVCGADGVIYNENPVGNKIKKKKKAWNVL